MASEGRPSAIRGPKDQTTARQWFTILFGLREPAPPVEGDGGRAMQATAFRIATGMVAAMIVGLGGGLLIDRWLGTRPWGLVVMFLLGAAAAAGTVHRAVSAVAASGLRQPSPPVKGINPPPP